MVSNIVLYAAAWLTTLRSTIIESIKEDRGQGILEYAVLVGAIVIVLAGAIYAFDLADIIEGDGAFLDTIAGCFEFDDELCSFG